MKPYQTPFAASNPFAVWSRLALQTNEMLMASAQVITHRTGRIAMAGAAPSARDRREFKRMGQEKLDAMTESMQAVAARMVMMNAQLGALAFRQALGGMSGWISLAGNPAIALSAKGQAELLRDAIRNYARLASQASGSMARIAHHGLRPIHSRATGNARRLLKSW
ncbi:MAG TPA: polyhydroxyalkanoate granule-associated phasin [Noviherbaspirillum sp.]